jgi:nucleotide-binding universal stress UspA family protein
MESFLKEELAYFRVKRLMLDGDPASVILQLAHEGNFDLIMMPTHGLGGFRRFLIGSVTAKVLHDTECPVFTGVHLDQAPILEKIEFRNIACAVKLEPHGRKVLQCAAELAEQYGATLSLTHITPAVETHFEKYSNQDFTAAMAADATSELEKFQQSAGTNANVIVEGGELATAVETIAKRLRADLLVIGRNPAPGILGRLRTHAYSIIRQSPCPVLSV